jgi:8-oxo-dGTP pyrophosphatase MutT (NUDIX family)
MALIDRVRRAIAADSPGPPILLAGDAVDPVSGDGQPVAAAVLIPIVDRPEPGVILTVRTDTVRRHAGQIAFPGGRIDPGDESPSDAALREAWEEIALPRDTVELIGPADPYRTVTGYDVLPIVGIIPPDLPLRPSPTEVAAIFEAPLHHLLDPAQQMVREVDWQGRRRCYYEIIWEGHRIWGATAAMIVNLSRRLAHAT